MTPGTFAGSVAQFAGFVAIGWVVADLLIHAASSRAPESATSMFGLPERALLSVVGFVGFSVVAMVAHIVSGGAVFGLPGIVPAAAVLVLVWGTRRGCWPKQIPWRAVGAGAFALGCLYIVPVFIGGSSVRTGDSAWHLGWTQQLLHGQPIPTGPAPLFDRNAYPWGFHAVLATMTRLVPGSTPVVAHEALHYVIVFSVPLAAACLARRVSRDAGWFAAAAAALIGGFGWIAAHAPAFITSPSDARFGADLVVASPNSVYELFPPAFPRELGLVLLGATAVLIAFAVAHLDRRSAAVAGVAMGMVGLVSVPMLVSALLWAAAATIVVPRGKRSVYLTSIFGAAVVVFALWAGPVVGNYVHYGGFVNITPQLGKEWALPTSLASWGFLLPLTIAGVVVAARMRVREKRLLIAFGVAAAALLVLALAREAFGWQLAGNATLLHQGRAWPPTHLLAGVFGGIALAFGYEALKRRSRATAATALATVLVLGAVSPALAAIRMTGILHGHADGFSYASADLQPGSFVRNASAHLSPNDVVRVRGNDTLAFFLFEFSGCRLASYDDPRLNGNDLRIRYADLARAWNRRMAAGGFRYDYIVVRASASLGSPEPVAEGSFDGVDYEMFRRVGGP